jgi:cell shape-determining protein MreC
VAQSAEPAPQCDDTSSQAFANIPGSLGSLPHDFMWQTLHHRGLLSLTLCLACAAGLHFAPSRFTDPIRNVLRSSLAPGASALASLHGTLNTATSQLGDTWSRFTAGTPAVNDPEAGQLRSQRDAAIARIRQLETFVAELRSRTQQAGEQAALRIPVAQSEPLLREELIPARVIGRERSAVEQTAARLIQCGTRDGVARDDFVIEPELVASFSDDREALLLDQGSGAGLADDFPVACGQTLLGRIRAVGSLASTVQLVTDPEFRVGAQILRVTAQGPVFGAVGVYAGEGSNHGRLELVAATQPVTVGDAVYTDEHVAGSVVRLYIGRITRADLAPGDPHWTIEVAPGLGAIPPQVEVLKVEVNPERLLSSRHPPDAVGSRVGMLVLNPDGTRSVPATAGRPGT